jgi:hypothetical protein
MEGICHKKAKPSVIVSGCSPEELRPICGRFRPWIVKHGAAESENDGRNRRRWRKDHYPIGFVPAIRKTPADFLIVDRADKAPVENYLI